MSGLHHPARRDELTARQTEESNVLADKQIGRRERGTVEVENKAVQSP